MNAVGSFLPPALEQFGGMRPPNTGVVPERQDHGSWPCWVGWAVGLRSGSGSETWEEESLRVGE